MTAGQVAERLAVPKTRVWSMSRRGEIPTVRIGLREVRYGDGEASVEIGTWEVLAGRLPPRALRLVHDWASEHEDELRDNWDRARRHEPLHRIEPLR